MPVPVTIDHGETPAMTALHMAATGHFGKNGIVHHVPRGGNGRVMAWRVRAGASQPLLSANIPALRKPPSTASVWPVM